MKITEEEIRPEKIFNEYLKLTNKDVIDFFANVETVKIKCPACNSDGIDWVKKQGFNYQLCIKCKTIYVSPRPINDAFNTYYTDSPSTKYWATTFYKITEAARREKLWKPKAQLIRDRILDYENNNSIKLIVDIGGGYGVFDEEIKKIMDIDAIIIEPSIHLAKICREKGLTVIEKFMEDLKPNELPNGRKCFVSFELFEHLHDPSKFLQTVFNRMTENDLFIFTTLSGMGVDIQVLKQNAKALSPPHHLNFLNPKSVTSLLEKIGFDVLEAITPGKLDMDILKNHKEGITEPFWRNIIDYYSDTEIDTMQTFISSSGLSSHMMITCRRP